MEFSEEWLKKYLDDTVEDLLNERNLKAKYHAWELLKGQGLIESSKCALFGELYGMIYTNLDWQRMTRKIKRTDELSELTTRLSLEHSYKIKSRINLIANK